MINKPKHPKDRGERRRVKRLHSNASPVAKLLLEREALHAGSDPRQHVEVSDRQLPPDSPSHP